MALKKTQRIKEKVEIGQARLLLDKGADFDAALERLKKKIKEDGGTTRIESIDRERGIVNFYVNREDCTIREFDAEIWCCEHCEFFAFNEKEAVEHELGCIKKGVGEKLEGGIASG